ncbi:MAG: hypothetical protein A2928_02825 [Candidatus Taylorbacteria bacterium RIFCSPLOWO2_01_FULL_45_15b]|uniref:AI-2E family transporter n=1 Tax=Candidatus Taylorbacteria bacterium RIFCSPLOWO2_01_FULL_45_15b TaxID=1802319 RepID=A0A1G2NFA4_9BACT|nr:MAG: hypothetical protein A2928_02825 [Candidatus Taylorbacteria bacterium RIFCSPLOWO2_01_FULL_45_15b]
MLSNKLQSGFYYALLVGILVLTYFIFMPYLEILVLAGILSVVFYPMFSRFRAWTKSPSFSAFISVIIILLVILIPVIFLGYAIFTEVNSQYHRITTENSLTNYVHTMLSGLADKARAILPDNIVPDIDEVAIDSYVTKVYQFVIDNLQNLFSSFLKIAINVFLLILAMFFLMRDGKHFSDMLIKFSPLRDDDDRFVIKKIKAAVNSVIKGSILIALLQGVLMTIGFFIFGVPSALLWGSLSVFAALVPSLGTSLVAVPAVLYLFFTSGFGWALGMLLWAVLLVGLIDNLLRPALIERDIKLHPLLVLLSVLGGITFFGPMGFLLGPIILAFLFALLDIYPEVHPQHGSST